MFPFRIEDQARWRRFTSRVVYAVRKAILKGQLRPGDRFPSVRLLSQELRINPNTAHKIVANLTSEGLLLVEPGDWGRSSRRRPRLVAGPLRAAQGRFGTPRCRGQGTFHHAARKSPARWNNTGRK